MRCYRLCWWSAPLLLCLLSVSTYGAPRPSARHVTPELPSLHVAFSVFGPTFTHVVAPLEYSRVVAAAGHRVTWFDWEATRPWFEAEAKRLPLPVHFVSVPGLAKHAANLSAVQDSFVPWLQADWLTALPKVFPLFMEPLYAPTYATQLDLFTHDRPDVVCCDMFAHSCIDVADKLGIPYVITVPAGLGDFGIGDGFDTPASFTGYSHQWHSQPVWHRFYNTFLSLPDVIYRTWGTEAGLNRMRAERGVTQHVTPIDKWANRNILAARHCR
jgi:hypothetical protein